MLNCAVFLLFLLLHPKRWWAFIDGEPQEDSGESIYWCRNLLGSCHCCMKKYFPLLHYIWILQKGKFNCSPAPTQSSHAAQCSNNCWRGNKRPWIWPVLFKLQDAAFQLTWPFSSALISHAGHWRVIQQTSLPILLAKHTAERAQENPDLLFYIFVAKSQPNI